MATLTVQELPANGATFGTLTFSAASNDGDQFAGTGREIVLVQWGGVANDVTVVATPGADAGRAVDVAIADAGATTVSAAGPFKTRNFNSGGNVQLTYGGDGTNITVAVVRFTLG
jgi:hypothetical protein